MRVGNFIPGLAPLRYGDDEAATAQTGQVSGDVRAGELELFGQLARITRASQQAHQNPGAVGIRHRPAEAVHHIKS